MKLAPLGAEAVNTRLLDKGLAENFSQVYLYLGSFVTGSVRRDSTGVIQRCPIGQPTPLYFMAIMTRRPARGVSQHALNYAGRLSMMESRPYHCASSSSEDTGSINPVRSSRAHHTARRRIPRTRNSPRHSVKRNSTCPGDENLKYEHTQRGGVEGDAARQERTEIGSIQPQVQAWPPSCKWTLVLFHGATTQRLLGCTPVRGVMR
ncbi:hypothetical protein EDB85DRAFT_1992422 [Lactarius pseudohatsudake]|nr:hypothetical protein EDB85DRAFT_1992422 [Lactarius pseudohatsudake]